MRRCLEDNRLACDNRVIDVAFTLGSQELQKLCGTEIQALGLKLFRLMLGLQLMLTFNEYHSYKNIVHVLYQGDSAWNTIAFCNKNIYRYSNGYTL